MKLGVIPELLLKSNLEFTPVDVAAQAIYKIVTNTSKKNRVFHVYNNNFITLEEYTKDIKDFGYNLRIVTEEDFRKEILKILQDETKKTVLQNIISDLDNNYNLNYNSDIKLNSDFTIKYLNECGFNWPIISKEYITEFIKLIGKEI